MITYICIILFMYELMRCVCDSHKLHILCTCSTYIVYIHIVCTAFDGGTTPIRLVINGSIISENNGTVEIFYNGTWGTVCDDYWGFTEAEVACHMLGFAGAVQAYYGLRVFNMYYNI